MDATHCEGPTCAHFIGRRSVSAGHDRRGRATYRYTCCLENAERNESGQIVEMRRVIVDNIVITGPES